MGFGEDRWVLQMNNHTRVQWRTAVPSVVKTEGELCVCTRMSTLHAHTHLKDCKAEWQTHKHWMHPITWKNSEVFIFVQNPTSTGQLSHTNPTSTTWIELNYSNSCQQFSAYIYTTHALAGNQFWVGPQVPQPFIYPFVYQPTCTTVGLSPEKWFSP